VGKNLAVNLRFNLLKRIVMKELTFEQMEEVQGGDAYCDLLEAWLLSGGAGYQGDFWWMVDCYVAYCRH
jgi:hypothetical protein